MILSYVVKLAYLKVGSGTLHFIPSLSLPPLPFPSFPFPFPSFPFSLLSLLRSKPINPVRGYGERCKISGVWSGAPAEIQFGTF